MERIRYGYGSKIAAVIHLAAYYSFNTKDSPGYDEINVKELHVLGVFLSPKDFKVSEK